ncbi:MAG: CoA pyrophosphatase [Betaproteobacteria bacterium]|nr:CoA pyrophosphatase [Betaproteobacteria bacterium]
MELDVAALKARLARATSPATVYGDDDSGRAAAAVTAAAVLVPIIAHPDGLTVLFTRRTVHLKAHSGQVSFPGGRAEPDDPTPEDTALREAEEEIGLARARVELLGRCSEYLTRTGFRVTPVIGVIRPPLELVPDAREVDEVFEVPLAFLLDPANHRRATREINGRTVGYYEIEHQGRVIWGATDGMLVNLYRRIGS